MGVGRLRVFVSSRMEELRHEREAIRAALAAVNVDTFLFELDAGGRQVGGGFGKTYYQDEEEAADIYVGLFWKGLGPHTALEFTHAWSLGMDCLIYERPKMPPAAAIRTCSPFSTTSATPTPAASPSGGFTRSTSWRARIKDDIRALDSTPRG